MVKTDNDAAAVFVDATAVRVVLPRVPSKKQDAPFTIGRSSSISSEEDSPVKVKGRRADSKRSGVLTTFRKTHFLRMPSIGLGPFVLRKTRSTDNVAGHVAHGDADSNARRVHQLEERQRNLEAALLAAQAQAEVTGRVLARIRVELANATALSAAEGGTATRAVHQVAKTGAAVQRQFLRSLDEIIGPANPSKVRHLPTSRHSPRLPRPSLTFSSSPPANPSKWADEFRDLLLMQDATIAHSRVTPEHALHLRLSSEELLRHYRYDHGDGSYERQIQAMIADGWSEADAVPVRLLPSLGAAAMSSALTHCDPTLAASCHAVARGIAHRAQVCHLPKSPRTSRLPSHCPYIRPPF